MLCVQTIPCLLPVPMMEPWSYGTAASWKEKVSLTGQSLLIASKVTNSFLSAEAVAAAAAAVVVVAAECAAVASVYHLWCNINIQACLYVSWLNLRFWMYIIRSQSKLCLDYIMMILQKQNILLRKFSIFNEWCNIHLAHPGKYTLLCCCFVFSRSEKHPLFVIFWSYKQKKKESFIFFLFLSFPSLLSFRRSISLQLIIFCWEYWSRRV